MSSIKKITMSAPSRVEPKRRHVIIDLERLARNKCVDPRIWERAFAALCALLNVRVITKSTHVFEPPFAPGLTAFFLLDASHLSVHTYADEGKAAIDLFACTAFDDTAVVTELLNALGIDRSNVALTVTIERFASVEIPVHKCTRDYLPPTPGTAA